jgi:hypothetical protein
VERVRFICRLFGWALFFVGLGLLVHDVIVSVVDGRAHFWVLGELVFKVAPGALNLAQAIIQRYIHPKLWDPVIQTMLLWWAAPVFLVPGIALAVLCRRKRDAERASWAPP